jgi:catabolite regulation protein CreA
MSIEDNTDNTMSIEDNTDNTMSIEDNTDNTMSCEQIGRGPIPRGNDANRRGYI